MLSYILIAKGIEKDAVRGRRQRGAAIGCKRLSPEPEQSPPWSRPPSPEREVDRDGTSRYRGHERRMQVRKQGGTVEYVFVSHP